MYARVNTILQPLIRGALSSCTSLLLLLLLLLVLVLVLARVPCLFITPIRRSLLHSPVRHFPPDTADPSENRDALSYRPTSQCRLASVYCVFSARNDNQTPVRVHKRQNDMTPTCIPRKCWFHFLRSAIPPNELVRRTESAFTGKRIVRCFVRASDSRGSGPLFSARPSSDLLHWQKDSLPFSL